MVGVVLPAALVIGGEKDSAPRGLASVGGRVTVLERGNRLAQDVGDAIVWLELEDPGLAVAPPAPVTMDIVMSKKEFRPHVVVVPVGSTVRFPNEDPFTHNVFSRSDVAPFDLGRYERGGAGRTSFPRPGLVRVFCNVHARMSAIVVVRDNPAFARPAADGSFTIGAVAPGAYALHAWHERAKEFAPRRLQVPPGGVGDVMIELDARDYQFVQHLNKFGQPYSTARRGRRY
jgi:plastocyanin